MAPFACPHPIPASEHRRLRNANVLFATILPRPGGEAVRRDLEEKLYAALGTLLEVFQTFMRVFCVCVCVALPSM